MLVQCVGELAAADDIEAARIDMLLAPAQYRVVARDCCSRDACRSMVCSGDDVSTHR
jgi:hypothetical protein